MRRKIKKVKKPIIKLRHIYLVIFIFLMIAVIRFLFFVGGEIKPVLLEGAELEVDRVTTVIITNMVAIVIQDREMVEDIFETTKSSDGSIQVVDFNSSNVNKLLIRITGVVQNGFKLLREGNLEEIGVENLAFFENKKRDLERGIILRVPIGAVTKNPLLSNLGPTVPVRMNYLGDVKCNINSKVKEYGINNALIELSVHVETTVQVILPFTTEKRKVTHEVPIMIKVIQGNIPSFYGGIISRNSGLYSANEIDF